ncbi:hypothetical protein NM208_g11203 [Fusarium decemcellulare]|uniref:Uncharacterized protein n=1 Tax=Fusarium decemcellulare TaxID=57161 RepID=A0ACC1RV54_9HYPO|nr:hypothetical protein NM208_g11203 [Fusarium decemcellulare]
MAPSLPPGEHKACFGCAASKRACDKQKPACQRCTEKGIDCQYPTTRRYLRTRPPSTRQASVGAKDAHSQHVDRQSLQGSANPTQRINTPISNGLAERSTSKSCTADPATSRLSFLELETWAIENRGTVTCRFNSGHVQDSLKLEGWTKSLESWLRQWVNEGNCPFIHRQLYHDAGLPPCLQDAWTH